MEKKFAGRVEIQIHNDSKGSVFNREITALTGTWLETEFAKVTSRENYFRVVMAMDLAKRWNLGNDTQSAVDKLGTMIEASVKRSTEMIVIEAYSPNQQEAADLANTVAEAYKNHRIEIEKGTLENAVTMLQNELDSQEKKVDEKRAAMLALMKKYDIIDLGGLLPRFGGFSESVDNGKSEIYKQTMQQLAAYEGEVGKLKAQLQALSNIQDEDQLREEAPPYGARWANPQSLPPQIPRGKA